MPTDEIFHRERFLVKVDSRDFTQIGLLVHIRLAHKQNDWLLLGIAPHTIVTRRQSLRSRYIKFMVYITICGGRSSGKWSRHCWRHTRRVVSGSLMVTSLIWRERSVARKQFIIWSGYKMSYTSAIWRDFSGLKICICAPTLSIQTSRSIRFRIIST